MRQPISYFTNEQLDVLRRIYIEACTELGIDWSDASDPGCESVAVRVMQMAIGGEREPDAIRRRATLRAEKPIEPHGRRHPVSLPHRSPDSGRSGFT